MRCSIFYAFLFAYEFLFFLYCDAIRHKMDILPLWIKSILNTKQINRMKIKISTKFALFLISLLNIYIIDSYHNILSKFEFVLCKLFYVSYFDLLPFSIDMMVALFLAYPMFTITYGLSVLKKYTRIQKPHLLKHHCCKIFYYILSQLFVVQINMILIVFCKYYFDNPHYLIYASKNKLPVNTEDVISISVVLTSIIITSLTYLTINMLLEFLKLNIKLKRELGEVLIDRRLVLDISIAILLQLVPNIIIFIIFNIRLFFIFNDGFLVASLMVNSCLYSLVSNTLWIYIYRRECGWVLPEIMP